MFENSKWFSGYSVKQGNMCSMSTIQKTRALFLSSRHSGVSLADFDQSQ